MKLLLTSAGLRTPELKAAAKRLSGKLKPNVVFIPTGANMATGGKRWLAEDYMDTSAIGTFEVADIVALPKEEWLARLKRADIIVMGGGNTNYLIEQLHATGLAKVLPGLLRTRVYVGISAGSIVACRSYITRELGMMYSEKTSKARPLGLVPFSVRPHLNNQHFPKVTLPKLARLAAGRPFYALDDRSGVQVVDGKVTVISDGVWKLFS